jgi:hypothetical protein
MNISPFSNNMLEKLLIDIYKYVKAHFIKKSRDLNIGIPRYNLEWNYICFKHI